MQKSGVVHTLLTRPSPGAAASPSSTPGRDFVEREKNSQRPSQPPLRLQDMTYAKRQNRKRRPARDATEVSVVWADAGSTSEAEAKELLDQGLRILARLAVRAYLRREASLPASDTGERSPDKPECGLRPVLKGWAVVTGPVAAEPSRPPRLERLRELRLERAEGVSGRSVRVHTEAVQRQPPSTPCARSTIPRGAS